MCEISFIEENMAKNECMYSTFLQMNTLFIFKGSTDMSRARGSTELHESSSGVEMDNEPFQAQNQGEYPVAILFINDTLNFLTMLH